MTTNKSQGQSVKHVGIDLHTPVFTHGQLYVALSQATSKHQIHVQIPSGEPGTQTQNVVYPEVLLT
jgi:ATP-dependent exoDNAse (exonuclease V) alpha subunit